MNKQAEFIVKLRDSAQIIADAANDLLASLAPSELKLENNRLTIPEQPTFTNLKWEEQKGARLGEFEIACKASNMLDKWLSAHNILRSANATIKERYHGPGYSYDYWIYNLDKIYRQKLQP